MNKIIIILMAACLIALVVNINLKKENNEKLQEMVDFKHFKNQEDVRKMEAILGSNDDTPSETYHKAIKSWTEAKTMSQKFYAMHLFEKAAEGGHPNAQFIMSQLYMNGEYLLPDYSVSIELLEKAGKQGMSIADIQLGIMYSMGTGITKDAEKGMQYLGRAATNDGNYASEVFDPVVEFVKSGKMDETIFEEFLFKTMDYSEKKYKNAWYKEHVNVMP